MTVFRSTRTLVVLTILLVLALLASGCRPSAEVEAQPAATSRPTATAESATVAEETAVDELYPLPVADLGVLIPNMTALVQTANAAFLSRYVPEEGLVIAPYGIGAPNRGLTGAAMRAALEAMFQGSEPQVVTYDGSVPGRIGLVVSGLNAVTLKPEIGDELQVTDPAYLGWRLSEDGSWQLWLMAVDRDGLLAEAIAGPPFTGSGPGPFTLLSDEEARMLVGQLESLLQSGDVEALSGMVVERGLVVAPYAVGMPEEGLTGMEMSRALQAMLQGAQPQVIAYDRSGEGKLGVVVDGLNAVEITPAVGEPLTVTSPAELILWQAGAEQWQLVAVVVDDGGLLVERLESGATYEKWAGGPVAGQEPPSPTVPHAAGGRLLELLRQEDVDGLMAMVAEQGLVIAPYGVGAPPEGLTGGALRTALEAILVGSSAEIVAVDLGSQGRVGVAVTGLNEVEVTPAVGPTMTMTSPALLTLVEDSSGEWKLWLLAPDTLEMLDEAIAQPPYRTWP